MNYPKYVSDAAEAARQRIAIDMASATRGQPSAQKLFPEDDAGRQTYRFAETDLFFPDADASFCLLCVENQKKHNPDSERITWADDKSVGDGSQIRRHLLEFLKAVQDGDIKKASREIRSVDWRGRELHQRWIKRMPPFNNIKPFEEE
jgi:hypothetical protein